MQPRKTLAAKPQLWLHIEQKLAAKVTKPHPFHRVSPPKTPLARRRRRGRSAAGPNRRRRSRGNSPAAPRSSTDAASPRRQWRRDGEEKSTNWRKSQRRKRSFEEKKDWTTKRCVSNFFPKKKTNFPNF